MSNQPKTPHDPQLEQEGCEGSASPTCSRVFVTSEVDDLAAKIDPAVLEHDAYATMTNLAIRLERERNHYREMAAQLARQNSALREIMDAPKCTCDGKTGWTEIQCCNLCGLPHKDEPISWAFTPENAQGD